MPKVRGERRRVPGEVLGQVLRGTPFAVWLAVLLATGAGSAQPPSPADTEAGAAAGVAGDTQAGPPGAAPLAADSDATANTPPGVPEDRPGDGTPNPAPGGPQPPPADAPALPLLTPDGRPTHGQSPVDAGVYEGLSRTWRRFIELLDKEDFAEILLRVDHLDDVRRDSGLPNLYVAAEVLSRAARQRSAARDVVTAKQLAQAAMRVAPDLPQPHYVMADLLWQESRGQIGEVLSHVFRGWLKEWTHLPSRMHLLANRLSLGLLTYLVVLFLVALVQLRRHFPALTHDVGHLFPRGVSSFQAGLFTLLLLFTPLFFSLGVLALLLVWVVAMWWYQNRAEKTLTVLLLVGALLLPFVARVATNSVRFATSPLAVYHDCLEGACTEPQVAWLEDTCRQSPGTALPCYTLATVRLRQGAQASPLLDDAVRLLEPLLREPGVLGSAIQVTYGNVLQAKAIAHCIFQRRVGATATDDTYRQLANAAIAAYDAGAAMGARGVALYDKSLMESRLGESEAADKALDEAMSTGDQNVLLLQRESAEDPLVGPCNESFSPNRRLAAADLPVRTLFMAGLGASRLDEVDLPLLNGVLLGRLGLPVVPVLVIVLFAMVVALALLQARVRPSWRCSTCNRVGCVHCRRELEHLDICDECLFIRVKGSFVDAKELWFRERRIQQDDDARRRMSRLLTFLAPGVGHLYRGHAMAGAIFLCVFAGSVLNAVFIDPVAPSTILVESGVWFVTTLVAASIAGIAYIASLVSIYRRK